MDPNVAFIMMRNAVTRGEWDEAEEHAINLRSWLWNGGCPPKDMTARETMRECLHVLNTCENR